MSHVTNCILCFSVMEDDMACIREVDAFFETTGRPQGFEKTLSQHASDGLRAFGGTKALETNIAVAAFNHLNLRELCQWMTTHVHWQCPTDVQLFVCDQEDDRFTLLGWDELTKRAEGGE